MKVIAIGATGFIGLPTIRHLAERGHEVAVIHRGQKEAALPAGVQQMLGDRDALSEMRPRLERFAPDVVLDVIAYTERHARELMQAFSRIAGRVVVVSSADVYRNYDGFRRKGSAPPDPIPLTESSPLRETLYPYRGEDIPFVHREDYEKILVERVVMNDAGIAGTVLRLPAVYGPHDRQHRLRQYLRRMDDASPGIVLGEGEARWRFTRGYVENVGAAIALAVADARAAGHIFNVGEDPVLTEYGWVQRIGEVAGWRGNVASVPDEQLPEQLKQPYDWRYHLATDTRKLRQILGYREHVPQAQAIEETIRWERTQAD